MAPQSTRETETHTTDQMAADVRRLVEQVTTDARKEIAQLSADARKTIDQAAADARKVGREVAEGIAAEIARRAADRGSYNFSATSFSQTGRSVNPSARVEGDYEEAADTFLNDLLALNISNTRLWFHLQRIPWIYVYLLDRSGRRSLEVQRRIYFETLKDAVEIATDILQERATALPAKYRVRPGDTRSAIAIRYYGNR